MARVDIVSVHYYDEYLARSVAAASDLALRSDAKSLVFVANKACLVAPLRRLAQSLASSRVQVSVALHDNTGLEFGAYEAGLRLLADVDVDWVVFANDTFAVHECFSSVQRSRLLRALTSPRDPLNAHATGQVESLGRSFLIEGRRTHRWLTTHVFALDNAALSVLGRTLYVKEIDALISSEGALEAFFSPALDLALAAHLRSWLFDPGARYSWYRAEALCAENRTRMAQKARAILQEKNLSARLEEAGAWFIDIRASGLRERLVKRFESALFAFRTKSANGSHR